MEKGNYCGQGSMQRTRCSEAAATWARLGGHAEGRRDREDLSSHFCKPQAGAHPGKVGKGEEMEEGGWLWLCLHCPRDHLGLPHPFSKANSPNGLAVPHPSSRFPGQWLCWLVPHVYKEPTHGRKGLPIFSFASTSPCIAHATSTTRATLQESWWRTAKERLGGYSLLAVLLRAGSRGVLLPICCSACGEAGPYKVLGAAAAQNR